MTIRKGDLVRAIGKWYRGFNPEKAGIVDGDLFIVDAQSLNEEYTFATCVRTGQDTIKLHISEVEVLHHAV